MVNILIVDDSDIDRMMIESNLRIPDAVCIAADNGQQALEKLREWQIDLVLTDLMMPRLNGLELVRAMRKDFAKIPVVVTTAMGSEDTAAQALNAGAASYIPKSSLAEMLRPCVQGILDISRADTSRTRLHDCIKSTHLEFDIGNDASKLRELVSLTDQLLECVSPLEKNDRLRIAIAIEQALNNALYRGNLEIEGKYKIPFAYRTSEIKHLELVDQRMNSKPYRDRRIQVVIDVKPTRFAMRIRDGGPGFNPSAAGSWDQPNERGIILMKAFMDLVEYSKEGNDVQMFYLFERDAEGRPVGQVHHKSSGSQHASAPQPKPAAPPPAATPMPQRKVARMKCMQTGKTVMLQDEKTVIGCRSGCHMQLPQNSHVAPLHCVILAEPGGWVLVQLAPQHATLVNTHQVEGRARLKHGDIVNLGRQDFEFELVTPDS